jgi:Cd2+/Zn2+-exporting ATPase
MAIGMLVHEGSVLLVIGIAMLLLRPTLREEAGTRFQEHNEALAS